MAYYPHVPYLRAQVSAGTKEATALTYKYDVFDCEWITSSLDLGDVLPGSDHFISGGNVTGLVVFQHDIDLKHYAAIVRCAIAKVCRPAGCRVLA